MRRSFESVRDTLIPENQLVNTQSTSENLAEAFAGESQANQKYRAFAKKAEQEGLPNIARLFKTAAEAERVHAEGHLRAMAGIGSTGENLRTAIAGETYEYTTMYPPMLEKAEAEGHRAKVMFGYAVKAEAVHTDIYRIALEAVERGEDLAEASFYVCPICGHIEMGAPPERCPICGSAGAKYVLAA
jgi:rubrerythrin